MSAVLGASEGSRVGLLCTWPLREARTCTCSRGLCWAPSHSPAPQPGVVGVRLLSLHSSMSVSSPCGHREGGDRLYPSTGLSCECVALVEIQDLRPGCSGRKALSRSIGGSPELHVGTYAARAGAFSVPLDHIWPQSVYQPLLRRRGSQTAALWCRGHVGGGGQAGYAFNQGHS